MPALIGTAIPRQNFEVIRDKLAAILALELPHQHALDSSIPNISKVYIERYVDINSETELNAINVSISRGDFTNQTLFKADGTYTYNVDVYTSAPTTDATGPADQYAMVLMQRLVGVIRSIFTNPQYKSLGLTPGILIGLPVVARFFVADKSTVTDALSDVIGRLQLTIRAIEVINDGENVSGVPLEEATTQVFLNGSTYGYYYSLNTAVPPPVNTNTTPRSILVKIKTSPDLTAQIPVGNGRFIQAEYAPCNILIPKLSTDLVGYLSNRPYQIPFIYNGGNITKPIYDITTGAYDRTGYGEGVTGFVDGDEIVITFEDPVH